MTVAGQAKSRLENGGRGKEGQKRVWNREREREYEREGGGPGGRFSNNNEAALIDSAAMRECARRGQLMLMELESILGYILVLFNKV